MRTTSCLPIAALLLPVFMASASAQWRNLPAKPSLSSPTPRTGDKPIPTSPVSGSRNGNRFTRDLAVDLKPGDVPFLPWAKALYDSRVDGSHEKEDPDANCLPQGVPKIDAAPAPWKIVQTPGTLVIVYEAFNLWRQVFMDGRQLEKDLNPTWMGYSTGTWDRDTRWSSIRVASTAKPGWISWGNRARMRFTACDRAIPAQGFLVTWIFRSTIDDPKAYSKPWTVTEDVHLLPDTELLEFICNENNLDVKHLPGQPPGQ